MDHAIDWAGLVAALIGLIIAVTSWVNARAAREQAANAHRRIDETNVALGSALGGGHSEDREA